MELKYFDCPHNEGRFSLAYRDWGAQNQKTIVCVHGLTRNSQDFNYFATEASGKFRVIAVDIAGRGLSSNLPNPMDYNLQSYSAHLLQLLTHLKLNQVSWLGTSMGGLLGMLLAAMPQTVINRLVLNDVGPVLNGIALERMGEYVGKAPVFSDFAEAYSYIRRICAPFGLRSDEQWCTLTEYSLRSHEQGLQMNYDPGIAAPFRDSGYRGINLWPVYDLIKCPTMLVRGAESDLLSSEVANEMTLRGPKARLFEVAGVGHAPMLMEEQQVKPVLEFFNT